MKFTGKNYKTYLDIIVKFKDIQPKYPILEVFATNWQGTKFMNIGYGFKKNFAKYHNYRVLSICDYEDTKTTSVNLLLREEKSNE